MTSVAVAARPSALRAHLLALLRTYRTPLLAFAASRVVVLGGTVLGLGLGRLSGGGAPSVLHALGAWDGGWYVHVAVNGYATHLVELGGQPHWTNIAFFPVYPMLVRATGLLLGLPALPAAILVANIVGALCSCAVWRLARHWDGATADAVVWLFCLSPGAIFLSMAYPEGVFVLASSICLKALHQRRWVLGGIAGAWAGATRSQGIVLIACCGIAALYAVWRRRDWAALAAGAIAPLGLLAFFAHLWVRTGDPLIWFKAMDTWGTHQGFADGLLQPFQAMVDMARGGPVTAIIGLAGFAAVAFAGYAAYRYRVLPLTALLYSAGVISMVLLVTRMGPRPRYLLLAFPLLLPIAGLLGHERTMWAARRLGFLSLLCAAMYTNGFAAAA